MLDQDIQQRFIRLPREQQDLITSDFAEDAATLFGESLGLTEEDVDIFENGIVLLLLYIFNEQDLKEYLAAHTKASHLEIHNVVSTLTRLLEGPSPQTATISPIVPSQPSTPIPIQVIAPPLMTHSLDQEIAEAEETFESVQGLRTMAGDVSAVTHTPPPIAPTYQSSQADLLTRTQAAPPQTPAVPRWDTEI